MIRSLCSSKFGLNSAIACGGPSLPVPKMLSWVNGRSYTPAAAVQLSCIAALVCAGACCWLRCCRSGATRSCWRHTETRWFRWVEGMGGWRCSRSAVLPFSRSPSSTSVHVTFSCPSTQKQTLRSLSTERLAFCSLGVCAAQLHQGQLPAGVHISCSCLPTLACSRWCPCCATAPTTAPSWRLLLPPRPLPAPAPAAVQLTLLGCSRLLRWASARHRRRRPCAE